MRESILKDYDCFVFDVDRTIAENGQPINPDMTDILAQLLKHVNIALVTSRSMAENLEDFAKNIAKKVQSLQATEKINELFIFPTHAARAYQVDLKTGKSLQLYNKGNDSSFLKFRDEYQALFVSHRICINPDVHYDESEQRREVQVHDRQEQVTLFFSHGKLRELYAGLLQNYKITITPHARNVLHIVPFGVDKKYAIEFLRELGMNKFLIFADGFYFDEENGRIGNDLTFALIPDSIATCINVGERMPKDESGVWYFSDSTTFEWKLTHSILLQIIAGFTFDQLGLIQKKKKIVTSNLFSNSNHENIDASSSTTEVLKTCAMQKCVTKAEG